MFYYNIKIKSNNGEYCLDSMDRDIIEREMDIYFAHLYGAGEEFISKIKKIEKKEPAEINNDPLEIKTNSTENISETERDNNIKIQAAALDEQNIVKKMPNLISQSENYFGSYKNTISEFGFNKKLTSPNAQMQENIFGCKISDYQNSKDLLKTKENDTFVQITNPTNNIVQNQIKISDTKSEKTAEKPKEIVLTSFGNIIQSDTEPKNEIIFTPIEKNEQIQVQETNTNEIKIDKPKCEAQDEIKIAKDKKEIETNSKEETFLYDTALAQEELDLNQVSKDTKTAPIGKDQVNEANINLSKEQENKNTELNKTIELVENAVKNVDIASDETFDIDIPDSYSQPNTQKETNKVDFDKEFDEDLKVDNDKYDEKIVQSAPAINLEDIQDDEVIDLEDDEDEEIENMLKDDDESMSSIFSDENPFQNPPESQNIIAAKEYPEIKQAVNLDFKTFLSNYESGGIIDDFLICAYYIKHISGQHSFNMKFINSKLFQATGNIADSMIINDLVENGYIKVIEVDGLKKYTISSLGEEYFMENYQKG